MKIAGLEFVEHGEIPGLWCVDDDFLGGITGDQLRKLVNQADSRGLDVRIMALIDGLGIYLSESFPEDF